MFQKWFVELVSVLSNIFVGISAIAVAYTAAKGVSTWKSELKGKARLEIGRRLTLQAYMFCDQYNSARHMITYGHESTEREKLDDETPTETQHRNEHFARMKRVKLLQGTLRELYQAAWEAAIVFDKDVEELVKPLGKSFQDLYFAIDTYFSRFIERAMKGTSPDSSDTDWLEKDRKIIYGHGDDDLAKEVTKNVETLVQELKSLM